MTNSKAGSRGGIENNEAYSCLLIEKATLEVYFIFTFIILRALWIARMKCCGLVSDGVVTIVGPSHDSCCCIVFPLEIIILHRTDINSFIEQEKLHKSLIYASLLHKERIEITFQVLKESGLRV